METIFIQIASALLYASAGFCTFLIVINRGFILLTDSKIKNPAILGSFCILVGGSGVLGIFLANPPWFYIPVIVLGLMFIGECRRVFIRHSCAGSKPIDTTPHKVNLTSPVTTTDLVVHRYQVTHPGWKGKPLRIVHLTDLHVNPALPSDYFDDVLSLAEQTEADIAVFTGDFITKIDSLSMLVKNLRSVGKRGSYAVLGNHDYWVNADAVRNVIKQSGLHLLTNETITLQTEENTVAITGYDYPWGTEEKSIESAQDSTLHMVLSHTPDNIYRIAKSSADLVFSGHYHAGQFRAPLLGPIIIPSTYGRRFDHGHYVIHDTHLFVASGIGAASPPLRIYCQPDIFVVDILPEKTGR